MKTIVVEPAIKVEEAGSEYGASCASGVSAASLVRRRVLTRCSISRVDRVNEDAETKRAEKPWPGAVTPSTIEQTNNDQA